MNLIEVGRLGGAQHPVELRRFEPDPVPVRVIPKGDLERHEGDMVAVENGIREVGGRVGHDGHRPAAGLRLPRGDRTPPLGQGKNGLRRIG